MIEENNVIFLFISDMNYIFLILLLRSTVTVWGGLVNITEADSSDDDDEAIVIDYGIDPVDVSYGTTEETVAVLTDDHVDTQGLPPSVGAMSGGDPLKITMWAAVSSKVLSREDRARMYQMGVLKPPLAFQKFIVVAHVDPSKNSPKILKSYEFNANINPE